MVESVHAIQNGRRTGVNTPKVSKLKSGAYRIQLMVDGERYSFTGYDPKELQQKAKEVYAGAEVEKRSPLTVGKAIDKYISIKSGVLSPSTIINPLLPAMQKELWALHPTTRAIFASSRMVKINGL